MSRLATLLLSAFMVSVCGSVAAAGPVPRGAHFQPGIEFSATEEGLEQGDTASSFNLNTLRDLWVRVRVSHMSHTSLVRLAFTTPRGEVFYETVLLYTREPRARQVSFPGLPHPRTAFPAKLVPGGYALDQPIPVGAGVFMRYPQPGAWRVEATVDGRQALAVRLDFTVAQ